MNPLTDKLLDIRYAADDFSRVGCIQKLAHESRAADATMKRDADAQFLESGENLLERCKDFLGSINIQARGSNDEHARTVMTRRGRQCASGRVERECASTDREDLT